MPDGVAQLVSLGIDKAKAKFALTEHDGNVEAAADWCFTEGATWKPADLLNVSHEARSGALSADDNNATIAARHNALTIPLDVPRAHQLRPGQTRVNVVLKQDQPTGKTVQGVVSEILTSGDHPRGVKVRLQDGRVGRVASIAT